MKLLKFNVEAELPAPPDPARVRNVFYDYIRHPEYKRILHFVVTAQSRESFVSMAVLSKYPGEGKTFLVSVLALGYATFLQRKVLIIDSVSQNRNESFYMGRIMGNEFNESSRSAPACIDLMTTRGMKQHGVRSRKQLTGPEHLARNDEEESFNTTDFQIGGFIESLKDSYDLILLDTCALSEADKCNMDPVILAKESHTSILVTSPRSVERANVREIKAELDRCDVRALGTVYNSGIKNE